MSVFNMRKDHLRFGTANKRTLYFQDGRLYGEDHALLPFELDKVQRMGYQITNEIRDVFVKEAAEAEHRQKMAELEAEMEQRKKEIQKDWKRKLDAMNEEAILSEVPETPQIEAPPEIPAITLAPMEVEAAANLKKAADSKPSVEPTPSAAGRRRPPSRAARG